MSKFSDVEAALALIQSSLVDLSREELAALYHQLEALGEDVWDAEIERDMLAGKLDKLVEEARAEHAAGRTTEIGSQKKGRPRA